MAVADAAPDRPRTTEGLLLRDLPSPPDVTKVDAAAPGTWVLDALPGSSSDGMHDVWVTPTQVFVVGDSGKVYLNAGAGWADIKPAIGAHLHVVRGLANGGVVAGGEDSQVLLWGNKTWVQMPLPTPNVTVTGVFGTAATDLWVVSASTIYRSTTSGGYATALRLVP